MNIKKFFQASRRQRAEILIAERHRIVSQRVRIKPLSNCATLSTRFHITIDNTPILDVTNDDPQDIKRMIAILRHNYYITHRHHLLTTHV